MQHAYGFIWGYEIKIVQIIFCIVIFDLLSFIRRITKFEYVPIYFIFFPAGHSDRLYAEYFNEDLFYQHGSMLTIQEKNDLRFRLIRMAIVSAVIASVASPWLTGFVLANFITENTFYDFIVVVFLILSYRIFNSLINARSESEVVRNNFRTVLFMYVMYLGIIPLTQVSR